MSPREERVALLHRLTGGVLPSVERLDSRLEDSGNRAARVVVEESRSGAATLRISAGRSRYIHSRYDPLREAQRLASQQDGFVVLLGTGCGYLTSELDRNPQVCGVLAVEPSPQVGRLLLTELPLDHLSNLTSKVRLRFLEAPEELLPLLFAFYLPMLDGRISLIVTEGYEDLVQVEAFRTSFRDGVAQVTANYWTMARFGRSWTLNIGRNCRTLSNRRNQDVGLLGAPERKPERLILAGAGPTLALLDPVRPTIAETGREKGTLLAAADTALPSLRQHGIQADIVLSIDAQSATYHHYLPYPGPQPRMVLADLTSAPLLSRRGLPVAYFGGGHPLAELLLREEPDRLSPSTEGGNVGYTLLSMAAILGSREALLYGLDFAYLRGAPYARGTYLDRYFLSHSSRLDPLATGWSRLLWTDPEVDRLLGSNDWSYTNPKLARFASRFSGLREELAGLGVRISRAATTDLRETLVDGGSSIGGSTTRGSTTGGRSRKSGDVGEYLPRLLPATGVEQCIQSLRRALGEGVDATPRPPWLLTPEERALLPLAAWVKEHRGESEQRPFLEQAAILTDRVLERGAEE